MDDSENGEPAGLKSGASFWTFEFYQQFFDVESKQVGDRILWSVVPKPGVSYLQSYIRPNPDLYGEFKWTVFNDVCCNHDTAVTYSHFIHF